MTLKRDMTSTEQKPKGTTLKVQSIAIENPLYIGLIHQCSIFGKECSVFGNIIFCPFRIYYLAPYTVPLDPTV